MASVVLFPGVDAVPRVRNPLTPLGRKVARLEKMSPGAAALVERLVDDILAKVW